MNLMAGHWCSIIHWLNPKACVNVKSDQLKVIKSTLRLSRHHVHTLKLMFKVGFHFWSLTTTKPIIKEALIYLGNQCPDIRYICSWFNIHLKQTPVNQFMTSNANFMVILFKISMCYNTIIACVLISDNSGMDSAQRGGPRSSPRHGATSEPCEDLFTNMAIVPCFVFAETLGPA